MASLNSRVAKLEATAPIVADPRSHLVVVFIGQQPEHEQAAFWRAAAAGHGFAGGDPLQPGDTEIYQRLLGACELPAAESV